MHKLLLPLAAMTPTATALVVSQRVEAAGPGISSDIRATFGTTSSEKKPPVFAVAFAAIADAFGGLFAGAGRKMPRSAHAKLCIVLALLLISGTPVWACGWWDCHHG